MTRELPIIEFAGTEFYVDIQLDEFRQVTNPGNKIHFDLLESSDDLVLSLAFDKRTLNAFTGEPGPAGFPENIEIILVPPFVSMDPIGVARKCDLPDNFFTED